MCIDMCIDTSIDMCIDMGIGVCIDMCIHMCIDMCIAIGARFDGLQAGSCSKRSPSRQTILATQPASVVLYSYGLFSYGLLLL